MAPDPETAAAAVAAARARQSEVAQRISSMSAPAEEGAAEASSESGYLSLWTAAEVLVPRPGHVAG